MNFTFKLYKNLLQTLKIQGFLFFTVSEHVRSENHAKSFILLRHDVETQYLNAFTFAQIQHQLGIKATYYFRISPNPDNKHIIEKIAKLGHEIGYHYDDLSVCKGNIEKAIQRFEKNLAWLRKIAPVETISMEGAPLSRWDNRNLWRLRDEETEGLRDGSREYGVGSRERASGRLGEGATRRKGEAAEGGFGEEETKRRRDEETVDRGEIWNLEPGTRNFYDYRDYGIICEPYFDIDFSEIAYYTDTGRRWDGRFAVRDKIGRKEKGGRSKKNGASENKAFDISDPQLITHDSRNIWPTYRTTNDMIKAIKAGTFPKKAMLTFHPQRWHDKPLPWLKELVWQNVKNQGKRMLIGLREREMKRERDNKKRVKSSE